jgi:hypothetical protein
MYISKTKSYTTVSLREIKEHLSIDSSDDQYDTQIQSLIKSVIAEIEKRTSIDIVPTISRLEDYNIFGMCYRIYESNISVLSISGTSYILTTPVTSLVNPSSYVLRRGFQLTEIWFKSSISTEQVNIIYTSGFSSMPPDLLNAIKLKVGYYFDADKNNTLQSSNSESKAFDRLIAPYVNLL